MVALNQAHQLKPATTGAGRFGNWLENMVDWNLSRSRFWGTRCRYMENGRRVGNDLHRIVEELNEGIHKSR